MRQQQSVLVVEDEPALRMLFADEFRHAGYLTEEAGRGDHAVELLRARPFDFLVTDIRMPGLFDGWDVAEIAHSLHPRIGIVYVTAFARVEGRQIAGSQVVTKPCSVGEIISLIQDWS